MFTLSLPIGDVIDLTNYGSPVGNAAIPFSAGLIIVANNQIILSQSPDTYSTLEPQTSTGTQKLKFQYKESTLAKYLEMKVYSSTTGGLKGMYAYDTNEVVGKYNHFGVKNGQIKFHTSMYADQNLLDFYFATYDQIEGAYPIFKKSFFVNGYTLTSPVPANIRFGVPNFFTSVYMGNQGDYSPTMLRIAGLFEQSNLAGVSKKMVLFFKNLVPFAQENEQITCQYSGVSQPKCSFYSSGQLSNGQSYQNFERIDIEFEAIPTGVFYLFITIDQERFQLLIPVKTTANKKDQHIFLAMVSDNSLYALGTGHLVLKAVYRLNGDTNLKTKQFFFTIENAAMSSSFIVPGIMSINYIIKNDGLKVGQNNTDITFMIGHADTAFTVTANSRLPDATNNAAFLLTSTDSFYDDNTLFDVPIADPKNKDSQCITLSYYQNQRHYVIFCPYEKGTESTLTSMLLKGGRVPFVNGDKAPLQTTYSWSDSVKGLRSFKTDSVSIIPTLGTIKIKGLQSLVRMGFKQEKLVWKFVTENPVSDKVTIKIIFQGAIQFSVLNNGKRCQLVNLFFGLISHSCTVGFISSATPTITFAISNCIGCPMPAGEYELHHWGIDNSATSGTKVGYDIRIESQQSRPIDTSKIQGNFEYDNSALPLKIYLGNLQMTSFNNSFSIDFQVDRNIYITEKIVLDLGGFANDNILNQQNLHCFVLDANGQPSILFQVVDLQSSTAATSLNNVQLIPSNDIDPSLMFTFKCNGVVIPFSFNPKPITASLMLAGTVTIIQDSNFVSIESVLVIQELLFPVNYLLITQKSNNCPGSTSDFQFNLTTTRIAIDANVIIKIVFPTTYPPQLSLNRTYCQLNSQFIACELVEDYTIQLERLSLVIPIGQTFFIRVYGVQTSALFYSGSIFVGLTNNTDQRYLMEYGEAKDIIPQNINEAPPKNIVIPSLFATNNYIRSFAEYQFKVVLPPGSVDIDNSLEIDFPSEWDMIINYKLPECHLYDVLNQTDYSSSCLNFGNRITMTFSQTDFIGNSFYYFILGNVRNPDYSSCGINMWVISVANRFKYINQYNVSQSVFGRSHSMFFNYPIYTLIKNPNQITLKWIDLSTNQEITILPITIGTYTGQVGLATDYGAFVRSFQVFSVNALFAISPTQVPANMGYAQTTCFVAGNQNAPEGLSLIEFGKTDDLDKHTALPFLKVFLSKATFQISTENTTYNLPIGGLALPFYFDFSGKVPSQNLRIDASLEDKGLFFVGKTGVTFNVDSLRGALQLQAEQRNVKVGQSGVIKFQVSSTVQQYYSQIQSVSYRIIDSTRKKPDVTLETMGGESRGATFFQFSCSCSQYSVLYYYISINGSQILYQDEIQKQVYLFANPSVEDPYNSHFGLLNFFVAGMSKVLVINQLRPQTAYNVSVFCQNTNLKNSNTKSMILSTKTNKGKPFYIQFTFDSNVNRDLTTRMTCFLSVYFKMPARLLFLVILFKRVRNELNDYCNYQRRLLQNKDELNSYNSKVIRFYFQSLDFQDEDTITPLLVTHGFNKSDFIINLIKTVAGLPSISDLSQPLQIEQLPPSFENFTNILQNVTQNSIVISEVTLDRDGFVYAMIDLQNRSRMPSFYDVRQGESELLLQQNITKPYYFRERFELLAKKGLTFEFASLQHYTNYTVYLYASADDPSFFQPRTYIYSINIATPPLYINYSFNLGICFLLFSMW